MTQITLEIREKLYISKDELFDAIGEEQGERFLEETKEMLTFSNPKFHQAKRFSKGRRFSKMPSSFCYFYLRKPKTAPSLEIPLGALEATVTKLKDENLRIKVENLLVEQKADYLSSIQLRNYQEIAVNQCLSRHRGVLVAPCGAGKTVMALELLARRSQKTLVIVHTLDLLKQWQERVRETLGEEAGTIGQGSKKIGEKITIATVQTLVRDKKLLMRLASETGTVIVDECHHTPAKTFSKVIGNLKPTYLYGFSATPKRDDGLSAIMHLFLGPTLHTIESRDLQRQSHLLRPRLKLVETEFFFAYDADDPESYHNMVEELIHDKERNLLICEHLVEHRDKVNLVLSQRLAHLEVLSRQLQMALPHASIETITGSTPKEERQEIIDRTREGKIQYLFATQLADEGLDIRCLENLFLVCPTRNRARVQQRVGRVMRTHEGKSQALIYDFVDSKTRVLLSQFRTRLNQVYRNLLEISE